MKKRANFKNVKGITLIALVITIIVLLILAGVSIAMLTGDNGILTQAQKADVETRAAAVQEQVDLWNSNKRLDEATGEKTAQSRDQLVTDLHNQKLLTDKEVEDIEEYGEVTIGDRTIVFGTDAPTLADLFCDKEDCSDSSHLHVGDYVNFQNPTSGKYDITSDMSGVNATQTYSAANNQNLNWRVLGVENGKVKLIAGTPMKLDSISGKNDPYLYLYGAWSYEYGSDAMDTAVRTIYGNLPNVDDARSVKIEDINEITGVTEETIPDYNLDPIFNSGDKQYGEQYGPWTDKYTPESWLRGQRTTVSGTVDGYYYAINASSEDAPVTTTVSDREYNLLFNNVEYRTGAQYWLSSPGVRGYSSYAGFGPGMVYTGGGLSGAGTGNLFDSDADSNSDYAAVRPVVILESGVTSDDISKVADKTEETWNYNGGQWNVDTLEQPGS